MNGPSSSSVLRQDQADAPGHHQRAKLAPIEAADDQQLQNRAEERDHEEGDDDSERERHARGPTMVAV